MKIVRKARSALQEKGPIEFVRDGARYSADQVKQAIQNSLGPIDQRIGSTIYGNPCGFTNNLIGNLAEEKARVLADEARPRGDYPGFADHAAELRTQGYTKLGQIYDPETFERVRTDYETQLREGPTETTEDPEEGTLYYERVASPGDQLTSAQDLVTHEVLDVLRAYYEAYVQVLQVSAYRTHHIPEEVAQQTEIYNDNWHYDGQSIDHVKLFVCLSDTDERDGPLHVLPKPDVDQVTQRHPDFERDKHGTPQGVVDEVGDPVRLTGPAGTAMLANTQFCLHRAGVPGEDRSRDLIQFYFAPSPDPLAGPWIEDLRGRPKTNPLARLISY